MAEKKESGMEPMEAMQLLQRMERLKRLMGTPMQKPPAEVEQPELFCRNRQEEMLSAAIPFLDREYQKEMYVLVRLMEMQRVLQDSRIEVREKQEQPAVRRRKLLGVLQSYLPQGERQQMETLLKMMDMKQILGREELQ